jgi:HEPN domain-containing protein
MSSHGRIARDGCCMARDDHAASLLRLARRDFGALAALADMAQVADAICGFHAQQAVEKALKAWLSALGQEYPLTHDLPRLFALLRRAGVDIERFYPLALFTPYAVQARYEEADSDAEEPLDRPASVAEVAALLTHVETLLDAAEE